MATITTRSGKGSPLTNNEVDANFTNLNTGKAELSGATFTGNLSLGDNVKLQLGNQTNGDLQIYHSGSHSFISEQGTGDLYIGASNNIALMNAAFSENKLLATTDGALKLYYNGSEKLATTSSGISVDGSVVADGLTVDGGGNRSYFNLSHPRLSDGYKLEWGGGTNYIIGSNASNYVKIATNSTEALTINSSQNVNIPQSLMVGSTTAPSAKLQVQGGTSGLDQISISSNTTANTVKYAGIIMTNYANTTTALLGGKAENGTTSVFYGSSGSDHRGVQNHIFYTNASATATSGNTERGRFNSTGLDVTGSVTVGGEIKGATAIRHAISNAQVIDNDNNTYFIINDPEGSNRIKIGDSGDRTTTIRNDTLKFENAAGTLALTITDTGAATFSNTLEVNNYRYFDGDYNVTYYRKANHTQLGYQLHRDNGKSFYEWNSGGTHSYDFQFISNNSPVLNLATNGCSKRQRPQWLPYGRSDYCPLKLLCFC